MVARALPVALGGAFAGAGRAGVGAAVAEGGVQQGGDVRHRRFAVQRRRQRLVADADPPRGFERNVLAGRGHRGHGMALVEDLVSRQDVAAHVAEAHLAQLA